MRLGMAMAVVAGMVVTTAGIMVAGTVALG
jgi:hypothetical protein